jgi:hypothetical protein
VATPARVELCRVTAIPSSTELTVRFAGEAEATIPRLESIASPAVDDVALVLRAGAGAWAVGLLNASPPGVPAPDLSAPPPPALTTTGVATVKPASTGTYRGGWRGDTTDLYQGDWTGRGVNFGAAYYGSGLQGLRGAITSARLTVRRLAGGSHAGQAPTMHLLAGKVRPAGAPSSLASAAGPTLREGQTADWAIPSGWLADLNDGDGGGIGISSGIATPYVHLAGRSAYAAAMTVRAVWSD